MNQFELVLGLAAIAVFPAQAQPFVFYRGIVPAASFHPSGPSTGSIARGSIFTIFGRNLGPAQFQQVGSFPLPTEFGGVWIQITHGSATLAALPLFVLNSQINALMPSNAPLGSVNLQVTFNGQAGNWSPVTVVENNPGLFSIYSNGFGPGVVQNFVSDTVQPINSTKASARPGQAIILWGTGLGPITTSDLEAPPARDLPVPVTVWVGGEVAKEAILRPRAVLLRIRPNRRPNSRRLAHGLLRSRPGSRGRRY